MRADGWKGRGASDFERKPLIGMVHLGALPGSGLYTGKLDEVIRRAVEDAKALASGGFDALMIENFFDAPFLKSHVPPWTIAAMTRAGMAIRRVVKIPIGFNVLRNDISAAISIAHACGGVFARCNVYVGAAVTDQGIIEGAAREAIETWRLLMADVAIWADIGVKHASVLGNATLEEQANDAVKRGLADVLIVSGRATGAETDLESIRAAKTAGQAVVIGSGLTVENLPRLLAEADGAIIGSSLKRDGKISEPIDPDRVSALVRARDAIL